MSSSLPGNKAKLLITGASIGLVYGLVLRYSAQILPRGSSVPPVMSIAFLFFVPILEPQDRFSQPGGGEVIP
jgi:hypothetical protein